MKIDIESGDINIVVDGQLVLHIGQISDDNIINLFLYPKGDLIESILHKVDKASRCTHNILKGGN